MSSQVRLIAAFAILVLASCGFTPMYGEASRGGTVTQNLDNIEIALIPDASGVYLRNILIDRFYQSGYPTSPDYVLYVGPLKESIIDLDITLQSEATSKQIRINAPVRLTKKTGGEVVLTRNVSALNSYNVLGSQFTTRVSEEDGREAVLADLARQIETQIALYFNR